MMRVRNERGTTVVELLIACLISGIVAAASMEFYVTQHKNWLMQNETAEVQQGARVCLDEIANTLRMGGYQVPAGHPACQVTANGLDVYFRNDATGNVDTTAYFIAYDNGNRPCLFRQSAGGNPELFGEDIEALSVTALGPRLLQVGLTARAARADTSFISGDGYRRRDYTTEVRLRNL